LFSSPLPRPHKKKIRKFKNNFKFFIPERWFVPYCLCNHKTQYGKLSFLPYIERTVFHMKKNNLPRLVATGLIAGIATTTLTPAFATISTEHKLSHSESRVDAETALTAAQTNYDTAVASLNQAQITYHELVERYNEAVAAQTQAQQDVDTAQAGVYVCC
jgi:hypothetical protein